MFSRFAGGAGTRIHAVTQIPLQDKDVTTSAVLVVWKKKQFVNTYLDKLNYVIFNKSYYFEHL